ncbi:MAG: YdcF family protein [Planctomycetota bacterium]
MAKGRRKTKTTGKRKTAASGFLPAVSRGLAFFLGAFSLLNVLGDLLSPGFDSNHWWIDLRPIHSPAADIFLAAAAVFLLAYSIRPVLSAERRILTYAFVAALFLVTAWNAVTFYVLVIRRTIRSGFPVAFSVFVCGALATVLISLGEQKKTRRKKAQLRPRVTLVATVMICMVGLPFAQMFCFGPTDYRRPADAIVVFGARVYADGRVSDALADRVRTGCELYKDGLAKRIIFSGGPGDGDVHETEAMRAMALKLGVPAQAIMLDRDGINTRATVSNTCAMFEDSEIRRVLAVSHFYHLPRIKMSYQRQDLEVYTVPAKESYTLTAMPYFMARETAALWVYYLRPLASLVLPGRA